MRFWRNPEFVRHLRAELRPLRALNAAVVVLVVSALLGLSCWASARENWTDVFRSFYYTLATVQGLLLAVWASGACGRSLANEREAKTFDFLRTTRLTPAELMVGNILGVPVMGYFAVGCSLPISVVSGLLAGISLRAIFWTYALILVFTLFSSLLALWGSMFLEAKSSTILGIIPLMLLGMPFSFVDTPFRGFAGFSVIPAVAEVYKVQDSDLTRIPPTFFGAKVSFLFLSFLLYAVFGAWLAVMIVRNLKREKAEVKVLSRWQAVGVALTAEVLYFAFLDPARITAESGYTTMDPQVVSAFTAVFDAMVLYFLGLATLSPGEKLRVWWRKIAAKKESYFSESAPSLLWLVGAAAIAYGLFVADIKGLGIIFPSKPWHFGEFAVVLSIFLVFVLRDLLFLQWCLLTHMKKPLTKGVLYLTLYYAAAFVATFVEAAVASGADVPVSLVLFTPFGFLPGGSPHRAIQWAFWCLLLQAGLAAIVLWAIVGRLNRPAVAGAVEA